MSTNRHADFETLLGAYAVDAVAPDEAERLERHLAECAACRLEVAEHRETAAFLASSAAEAPTAVWERIVAELESPDKRGVPLRLHRPQVWHRAQPWLAVAAAALVVLGSAYGLVRHRDTQRRADLVAAALAADSNPQSRHVVLRGPGGALLAHAVVTADGRGFLWNDRLASARSGRTYQLWAIAGDHRVSAGLLGATPKVAVFHLSGGAVGLAITEEAAGGAIAPTSAPLAVGLIE